MPEVTNGPIYEVLKAVQARLGDMEESQRKMPGEFRAFRGHPRALQTRMDAMRTDVANVYEPFSAFDARSARVDIIATPAS